jgi:hypothetical protein
VFVALGIQHATRMPRVILPPVACPSLPYISTLSHKRRHFRQKKVIGHKMCVLIFSTNIVSNTYILRRIERDFAITVRWAASKVPVILVRF